MVLICLWPIRRDISGVPIWTVTVLSVGWRPRRWKAAGLAVPVVDACLFVAPQHPAHFRRDLGRTRRPRLQQPAENLPHLRRRHRRDFFPPGAPSATAGTTGPT